MKKLQNNKSLIFFIGLGLFALAFLPIILYLININSQSLIADDYAMFEYYKSKPLVDIILDIIFTRQTPHVRFVFIPHLIFIPFFKYTSGQVWAVNLFFIFIFLQLFGLIPFFLAKILKLKKIKLITQCLFIIFTFLTLNYQIWFLLDFKLGSYIITGVIFMLCYIYLLININLNRTKNLILIILAFILSLHATDINILLIIPTIIIVLFQEIKLKSKIIILLITIGYPPLFYIANKRLIPRQSALFQDNDLHELLKIFKEKLWYFIIENKYMVLLVLVFLLFSIALSVFSFSKASLKKTSAKSYINKYVFQNMEVVLSSFFIFYGFGLLFVTNLAYGGWINPHQYSVAYLMLIFSFIFSVKYVYENKFLVKYSKVFVLIAIVCVGFISFNAFKDFRYYLRERYYEIQAIEILENYTTSNTNEFGEKNLIVIDEWPDYYLKFFSIQAFYDIDWASRSYADKSLNKDGKSFTIADKNFKYEKAYDRILLVNYNPTNKSLNFDLKDCMSNNCKEVYNQFYEGLSSTK